ncbi:hypothetical protein [Noviherbaspirillum autotrophicum]|uniref:Uncharacterized protein n=1 Tax=Noviherbaspirillum autotrophicum TaxID=709839 RepID=A0A0C2BVK9_9BURK|nr:hypothetical protein [Noviherbaspirillum autotrophicum]KIF80796.1 hypothetical protein TSA66_08135 [Noviherbaspirillum autotrophicum]KIF80834.1 hypothetical protein TSA66_08380 [Noviherbaspirillum autotrophicum]KIF84059.1 hypothetical protein TSA66_01070 [Noviherbaspirillum autotrophicum]
MPASKKPRHKRKVKTTGKRTLRTQPWKTHAVFRPLEAILDQLENEGTLVVVARGKQAGLPVFRVDGENTWYAVGPALRGLIETFELHEQRSGRVMPLEPLRRLVTKLDVDMPIFEEDTKAVRASMAVLIEESHNLPRDYAADLVQVTQTAIEFDRLKEAA